MNQYSVLFTTYRYSGPQRAGELELPPILMTKGSSGCVILGGVNYPNLLDAWIRTQSPTRSSATTGR